MGCYSQWDTYLTKGSYEYEAQKDLLKAKFRSAKLVIDYYISAYKDTLPSVVYAGHGSNYDLLGPPLQKSTLFAICHHLMCDGLNISDLLDLESITDKINPAVAPYAYILIQCHLILRAHEIEEIRINHESKEVDGTWFD